MRKQIKDYEANYRSALSFLKLALKEQAYDCLNRAYGQVPKKDKKQDNVVYVDILDNLAILSIEKADTNRARLLVDEGLALKANHTDLLFLKSVLLFEERRFDEMLEAIILYLVSITQETNPDYNFKYLHEGALNEVYGNLLPAAYRGSNAFEAIRGIVERLHQTTGSEYLGKACTIMHEIDESRGAVGVQ